jgi:toxin ParE1/3/4
MRIEWLLDAEREAGHQLDYIAENNPSAAIKADEAIRSATRTLAQYPKIGRLGRVRGTRELPIGGTPYILIYRIEADAVVVIQLLHGAQDWPAAGPLNAAETPAD